MSLWVASLFGAAYAGGMVGLHRFNVWRQRTNAKGFSTLAWVDWNTLLHGLLPPGGAHDTKPPIPVEGGPPPFFLMHEPAPEAASRHALLCQLVTGHRLDEPAFESAGFSGGEAQWLAMLSRTREEPDEVLARLDALPVLETAEEVYLREHLFLTLNVHALNLELAIYSSKRRLVQAIDRFPDQPALHFIRARASSLLGFTRAVLDDLARAVYFSRQSPFYLQAVVQMPWIEEARPALLHECRAALAQAPKLG